jgi:de-etiolated-1
MMDVASIQLHREFCLITNDSRHVLIATSIAIAQSGSAHPNLLDMYHTNESLESSAQLPMEDITIYCVDIINGRLCDQLRFKCDRITLAHNQGVYLFERLVAVLSLQHQIIHLYQVGSG